MYNVKYTMGRCHHNKHARTICTNNSNTEPGSYTQKSEGEVNSR